jgi:sugar phosphate isomerase/epimerase
VKIKESLKIGGTSSIFGGHPDRYVTGSYKNSKSLEQRLKMFAKVEDLKWVDLGGGYDITLKNASEVKKLLGRFKLFPAAITADIYGGREFAMGSVCSPDSEVRKKAWDKVKDAIDSADIINCDLINLWFGQDGYDYPFQVDYLDAFKKMVAFLKQAADYNPNISLAIEYKALEPRKRLFMSTAAVTLAVINEAQRPNLGIILDNGHAWNAGENISETVAFLKLFGNKLKYIHINDNYKSWDDDMAVGSIHLAETLEFLYWLEKTGYGGCYTLDIDASREDALGFVRENVAMLKKLRNVLKRLDEKELESIFRENDSVRAIKMLREKLVQ